MTVKSAYVGVVLLSDEKVNLRMPKMADIMPAITAQKPLIEVIVTACTAKEFGWFLELDLEDGRKLMQGMEPILAIVLELLKSFSPGQPASTVKH